MESPEEMVDTRCRLSKGHLRRRIETPSPGENPHKKRNHEIKSRSPSPTWNIEDKNIGNLKRIGDLLVNGQ